MTDLRVVDSLVQDVTKSDYESSNVSTKPFPKLLSTTVVALCIFLLIFAGFRAQADATAVNEERSALVSRIEQRTSALAAAEAALLSSRQAIDALQTSALNATSQGAVLAERVGQLEVLAGLSVSAGPGLVITVNDSPAADSLNPSLDRVLDQDLQSIVNGLWQSGAAAIAINGHRLTSTSAIRSAGIAILVDYRPLNPPYIVSAVAGKGVSAQDLARRFSRTAGAELLRELRTTYRIESSIDVKPRVSVPAAASVRGSGQP